MVGELILYQAKGRGIDRQRGNNWVNKCVLCEKFCLHNTETKLTYDLIDPLDEHSEIDDGSN